MAFDFECAGVILRWRKNLSAFRGVAWGTRNEIAESRFFSDLFEISDMPYVDNGTCETVHVNRDLVQRRASQSQPGRILLLS
jgi:hypothetical protein